MTTPKRSQSPKQQAARVSPKRKAARKPINVLAAIMTDTYRHMGDDELVAFARSRGSWWTTRAGQIERAGVRGFRDKVRAALAKAAKTEGK